MKPTNKPKQLFVPTRFMLPSSHYDKRRADRAAVHVVLREQPARESARRAVFKAEFAHDRRNEAGKLGGAAAENIKTDCVPLRRASQHERRERGDVALAAAGEIDKIKYALNAAAADSVHHRAVERISRKTAVLGLERRGKRVPAERVAAAGIVDDMPAAAAAKMLSGGVFAVTDRARSRDENAPRRLHRACERDLMVAAEKELSGKAVRSKLRAQYFPHRRAGRSRAADAQRAACAHIAAEREDLPHAAAEAVLTDGGSGR